jgi:hypothetical protein
MVELICIDMPTATQGLEAGDDWSNAPAPRKWSCVGASGPVEADGDAAEADLFGEAGDIFVDEGSVGRQRRRQADAGGFPSQLPDVRAHERFAAAKTRIGLPGLRQRANEVE